MAASRDERPAAHLLVMTTGADKAYTASQIIWRLWKSGAKKRIGRLKERSRGISQHYVIELIADETGKRANRQLACAGQNSLTSTHG